MSQPAELRDNRSGSFARVPVPDDYVEFARDQIEQSVVDRFEQQVRLHVNRRAVRTDHVDLTYGDLNRSANRIAQAVLARHPAPCAQSLKTSAASLEAASEPVAVLIGQGSEAIAAAFGVLKAGKVYVPLEPADSMLRIRQILNDLPAKVLVTNHESQALARDLAPQGCDVIDIDMIARDMSDANPELFIHPDAHAYVSYTSGSTGDPKGVIHTHRSLLHDTISKSALHRISKHDRCSLLGSGTGQALKNMTLPLLNGASLYPKNVRQDGVAQLADWLIRQQITMLIAVAPLFRKFLDLLTGHEQFPHLRLIRPTSDCVYPHDVERFQKHFAPHCVLLNVLSSTETGTICAYVINKSTSIEGSTVPVGYPPVGTEVLLLDEKSDSVSDTGVGVIAVRSPSLFCGYWRRPDLTRKAFRADNGNAGPRLYRSGDVGCLRPDGALEHIGRCDFQVKIRGFLVDTTEVEAALLAHEKVQAAVVHAWERKRGQKQLIGYIVPAVNPPATPEELRASLEDRLVSHMIPSLFITLDSLPLLASGKVDRCALPEPPRTRPTLPNAFVTPGSPVEEVLAKIWSEVLTLDEVGVHDHFLDLGGDSLRASQVIARVIDALGIDLPLRSLFDSPTVSRMATLIEHHRAALNTGKEPGPGIPLRTQKNRSLSFAQQRLWLLKQLQPGSAAYNMPKAFRLRGPLDFEALQNSIAAVVTRHEVLRTTYQFRYDAPESVVGAAADFDLSLVDLRDEPESEREFRMQRRIAGETLRPFDLNCDLMLRCVLYRLGADEHVLLCVTHHIASDHLSRRILIREIAALYETFSRNLPSPLSELPVQYADYAAWQRRWLQGDVLDRQLAYWKERLAGAPAVSEFPVDFPRPAVQGDRGARQNFMLDSQLTLALQDLSRRERVTLFVTFLAVWQVLLARHSGEDDIVVGSPIAARSRTEFEGLIGLFSNTLALRTDLSGDPTFLELVQRVRNVVLGAFAHQDLPFEKLIEELHLQRNLSHSPLFQTMLVVQNTPPKTPQPGGLTVTTIEVEAATAKFDITLSLHETADGVRGSLEYSTDLFEAATIARLLGHFQVLLDAVVADPERPISELPMLTEAERRQVVVEWNQTATDFPSDKCVHQLFEEQVERTPDAHAVVFQDRNVTYRELNDRANGLAYHLQSLGVGPDVRVCICLERGVALVEAILGVLKAGGAYVPLDPTYPAERLRMMLDDSQAHVVLTRQNLVRQLPACSGRVVCLDSGEGGPQQRSENPACLAKPSSLAYLLYTSGSTGTPKGVAMPHRALVNLLTWQIRESRLSEGSRTLQFASASFDVSFQEIFSTWCAGGTLVPVDEECRRDPVRLWEHIVKERIERLFVPFVVLQQLAEFGKGSDCGNASVREIVTAGEQLRVTPQVVRFFAQLNGCKLYNQYGPTETHVVTAHRLDGPSGRWPLLPPIGRPVANTQIYILDPCLQPVPVGVTGELYVGGVCLARGYFNRPALTAERFVSSPFSREPAERLYRTGDLARWRADGQLEYLGRCDQQVKLRGFRIELGEIESALADHPRVAQAVVLLREDRPGDKRLVAYVVSVQRESAPTASALRGFLLQKLPEYFVPSAFVMLDELPLTPNGKVDRRLLPAPVAARPGFEDRPDVIRNHVEDVLADLWAEVLGVESVRLNDNFFELGGHSLLAVRLFARIEKRFQKRLPLALLFQHGTVAGLARHLNRLEENPRDIAVVELQTGKANHRPLFSMPTVGGDLMAVRKLIRDLGMATPVYGLQPNLSSDVVPRFVEFESTAAQYVEVLRDFQPRGPYALIGYSYGGLLAYEVARQLTDLGSVVDLLVILDSGPGNRGQAMTTSEQFWRLFRILKNLPHWIQDDGRNSPRDLYWRVRAMARRFAPDWFLHLSGKTVRKKSGAELIKPRILTQNHELMATLVRAFHGYTPKAYPGKVTLFRARTRRLFSGSPDDLGWRRFAAHVDIREIPGHHNSILDEPHVRRVAEELRDCLDRLQT